MLKVKALQSFNILVTAYQSTRCNIPKDSNLNYDLIVGFISAQRWQGVPCDSRCMLRRTFVSEPDLISEWFK